MPKIALPYHTGKQHYQNVLPLNAIITNNPLFNMQISTYPDSEMFKWGITLYLNLIGYVVEKIQVNSYHVNTELCCHGCRQEGAASSTYILTKLNPRFETGVRRSQNVNRLQRHATQIERFRLRLIFPHNSDHRQARTSLGQNSAISI